MGIGIPKYLNMHKSRYNFFKKRNKCEVTIKSTITKRTISKEKSGWNKKKKKNASKETNLERERERERESIDLFVVNKLERIGKRGGNEVKKIYKKIKLEE